MFWSRRIMIIKTVQRRRLYFLLLELFSCRLFCILIRWVRSLRISTRVPIISVIGLLRNVRTFYVSALSRACVILREELKTRCAVRSKRESQ